jgi:hypothetical protein
MVPNAFRSVRIENIQNDDIRTIRKPEGELSRQSVTVNKSITTRQQEMSRGDGAP